MLTNDDFVTKEALLDAIKRKREQNTTTDNSVGDSLWRSIPNVQVNDRTTGGETGAATSTIHGGNGTTEDSDGGYNDIGDQLGRLRSTNTGNYSSIDQHYGPTPKRSTWASIKNVGRQYKEIFTKEEKHTDAPIRLSKKVDGKKLTDAEVLRLRPKLVEYVLWQAEHADQFIIATTSNHDPSIEIWGDITVDEAEIIVDYLLSRGKTDIRTAQAVRYASTLIDRLKLGLIIGPRAYKTAMIYIQRGFSIRYA